MSPSPAWLCISDWEEFLSLCSMAGVGASLGSRDCFQGLGLAWAARDHKNIRTCALVQNPFISGGLSTW